MHIELSSRVLSFLPGGNLGVELIHFSSLALRLGDRPGAFGSNGKLVRAREPQMSLAASSYALAASSAVSNVPSHILVFLEAKMHQLPYDN